MVTWSKRTLLFVGTCLVMISLPLASKTESFTVEAEGVQYQARLVLPDDNEASKALILLSDFSLHPDSPRFIQPLREKLPKAPWALASLSLEAAPAAESLGDEQPAFFQLLESLLDQCILKLNEQGIEEYALAAHGHIAFWVSHWLKKSPKERYQGIALLNLRLPSRGVTKEQLSDFLPLNETPLLELYGRSTPLEASFLTPERRRAKTNEQYKGLEIIGADHFFSHQEHEVVKRLQAWLDELG